MPNDIFRARHILGTPAGSIEDGLLVVEEGRIVAVTPYRERAGTPCIDLGSAILCPGFVNAHAHLDLSAIGNRIPAENNFGDWLAAVVNHRRASAHDSPTHAIRRAIEEIVDGGTTLLGDIAALDASEEILREAGMPAVVFREVIGLKPERYTPLWQAAMERTETRAIPGIVHGISPHAPYSTATEVFRRARRLSAAVPLATHWAESVEEKPLLAQGIGPLRDFLTGIGAWVDNDKRTEHPLEDLLLADGCCRWILIHANYLSDGELDAIATAQDHGRIAGVVYCPRTHAHFGHARHPFLELRARGVPVALGTDSLASNPDLLVWNEARFLARHRPEVAFKDIFEMLTLEGARVLGQANQTGSLEPGKRADLVVIDGSMTGETDPWKAILAHEAQVTGVMIGGQWKRTPRDIAELTEK
ncbi:MAG: amidohydrolase family protein [Planctomycetota bacterium]